MAERLGCTRGELLRRISGRELAEWMALESIRADEIRAAEKKAKAEAKRSARS